MQVTSGSRIERVTIYNRADCFQDNLGSYQVWVSNAAGTPFCPAGRELGGRRFVCHTLLCPLHIGDTTSSSAQQCGITQTAPSTVGPFYVNCGGIVGSHVTLLLEVAVANARISLAHLSNGRWKRVHEVRTSVSIYFIVAELLYAYDLWRRKGARAWTGIRCVVIVGCVVRLVANCLLLSLGHDHLHAWRLETIYLPGNITFLTSMVIDIGYMVFFAFGVSPHNRRRLSQLMGRDSVVCSLAELLTEPDEVRGTSDSESASDAPSVRAPSENASDAPRVLTPSDEHASAASEGRRLPSAHSSGLSKRDSGAYVGPLHARGRRGAASCY